MFFLAFKKKNNCLRDGLIFFFMNLQKGRSTIHSPHIMFAIVKYISSNETINFEIVDIEEHRNKYSKEGSTKIFSVQSNSVCFNKNKSEVALVNSETPTSKFFNEDHISKIKASERNIYLLIYAFCDVVLRLMYQLKKTSHS